MPTKDELLKLGQKAFELKEKDKLRTKVNARAVRRLIAAHGPEYRQYQIEESNKMREE